MLGSEQKTAASQTKSLTGNKLRLGLLLGLVGLSITLLLIAIFGLAAWAETAPLHHGLQHALIFISGLGVGACSRSFYQNKSRSNKKHES